jgi:hypothetical protein
VKIGDCEYRLTRGSDIARDGMFLEADLVGAPNRRTVAEVFYSDVTGKFTVTLFEESVPAELLEFLIADARKCLPPTKGGR